MKFNTLKSILDQSGSIVPIVSGKRSIIGWNQYQTIAATEKEVFGWVESGSYDGFGCMMGYGGFHVIDIDQKNVCQHFSGSVFREVWKEVPDELKDKLTVQRTMNGGEHIIYRCPVEASHITLAKNPENGKVVIEGIGSQSYIRIYDDVPSGSWCDVKPISVKDHQFLIGKSIEVGCRLFGDQIETDSSTEVSKLQKSEIRKVTTKNLQFVSASAAEIERNGIDITENYEDWIRVGYAISNEVGEDGREYFHKISGVNLGYDPTETDSVFNSILKGERRNGKATGGTLRHLMKKYKVPAPEEEGKVAQKTKLAISHIRSKELKLNEFTNKVEVATGELLTDRDVNNIYIELRKRGLSISKNDVAAIINSGEIESINPLRQWLKNVELSANDAAIKELLDCLILKDDDPEMQNFIRGMVLKWMLQIPAMIYDGVLPRLVPVAIGGTYIGKSEFFRRLLPPELSKYYAESGLDRDKDSEILMSEHLIVNVDELAGIMRSSKHVERFKSISSAQNFTLRTPYGKINERFQRKAILCGTSNKLDIIMDHDTGNSRIIPLELVDIDKEKYNSIDREALFGALAKMYKNVGKEVLYLSTDEREKLQRKSDDHTVVNIEKELISMFIEQSEKNEGCFLTVTQICDFLADLTEQNLAPQKVSREMNNLGFIKDRKRVNGSRAALNGFYCKMKDMSPRKFRDRLNEVM